MSLVFERKPVILLNASVLVMGGALQAALNFIEKAKDDREVDWHFLLSPKLMCEIQNTEGFIADERFIQIDKSPAKSIAARRQVVKIVNDLHADAVFTFFGPSYVWFNSIHFLGFAVPSIVNPNKYMDLNLNGALAKLYQLLLRKYKALWLRKADYWIVETTEAQKGVARLTGASDSRVAVVPNGCRDVFKTIKCKAIAKGEEVNLLCISAYYPHKNFEVIPWVCREIKRKLPDLKFKFILTFDAKTDPARKIIRVAEELNVSDCLDFVGAVAVDRAHLLYEKSHIAFIPTLLEVFSAAYAEAMACQMPIVTSNLGFANAVCRDAARYFEPNDAQQAADAIIEVINNKDLVRKMTLSGVKISDELPDARRKYELYKKFILSGISLGKYS